MNNDNTKNLLIPAILAGLVLMVAVGYRIKKKNILSRIDRSEQVTKH